MPRVDVTCHGKEIVEPEGTGKCPVTNFPLNKEKHVTWTRVCTMHNEITIPRSRVVKLVVDMLRHAEFYMARDTVESHFASLLNVKHIVKYELGVELLVPVEKFTDSSEINCDGSILVICSDEASVAKVRSSVAVHNAEGGMACLVRASPTDVQLKSCKSHKHVCLKSNFFKHKVTQSCISGWKNHRARSVKSRNRKVSEEDASPPSAPASAAKRKRAHASAAKGIASADLLVQRKKVKTEVASRTRPTSRAAAAAAITARMRSLSLDDSDTNSVHMLLNVADQLDTLEAESSGMAEEKTSRPVRRPRGSKRLQLSTPMFPVKAHDTLEHEPAVGVAHVRSAEELHTLGGRVHFSFDDVGVKLRVLYDLLQRPHCTYQLFNRSKIDCWLVEARNNVVILSQAKVTNESLIADVCRAVGKLFDNCISEARVDCVKSEKPDLSEAWTAEKLLYLSQLDEAVREVVLRMNRDLILAQEHAKQVGEVVHVDHVEPPPLRRIGSMSSILSYASAAGLAGCSGTFSHDDYEELLDGMSGDRGVDLLSLVAASIQQPVLSPEDAKMDGTADGDTLFGATGAGQTAAGSLSGSPWNFHVASDLPPFEDVPLSVPPVAVTITPSTIENPRPNPSLATAAPRPSRQQRLQVRAARDPDHDGSSRDVSPFTKAISKIIY